LFVSVLPFINGFFFIGFSLVILAEKMYSHYPSQTFCWNQSYE